jgi:hypothetical protein
MTTCMPLEHLGPFTHTNMSSTGILLAIPAENMAGILAFVTVGPRLMEMQRVQLFFILVHFFFFLAIIVFLCSTNISFCLSHHSVLVSLLPQGYLSE